MNSLTLSIIVPVMNEEETIGVFVERLTRVLSALDDPAKDSRNHAFFIPNVDGVD